MLAKHGTQQSSDHKITISIYLKWKEEIVTLSLQAWLQI